MRLKTNGQSRNLSGEEHGYSDHKKPIQVSDVNMRAIPIEVREAIVRCYYKVKSIHQVCDIFNASLFGHRLNVTDTRCLPESIQGLVGIGETLYLKCPARGTLGAGKKRVGICIFSPRICGTFLPNVIPHGFPSPKTELPTTGLRNDIAE